MAGDWQSIQNHLHPIGRQRHHNQSKDSFSDYSTITKYYNSRANAMHCSTHPQTDAHVAILNDPNIQKITANALQYFKLFLWIGTLSTGLGPWVLIPSPPYAPTSNACITTRMTTAP